MPIGIQHLLPTFLQLRNALAVKLGDLRRKEGRKCLPQVCLIGEGFPTKVVVQGMEDVIICWHNVQGVRWMVQCLPAKSL